MANKIEIEIDIGKKNVKSLIHYYKYLYDEFININE